MTSTSPSTPVRKVSADFSHRFAVPGSCRGSLIHPLPPRPGSIRSLTGRRLGFDLVLAGPGLEQRFLDEVRIVAAGGHRVPVIAPEHLISPKVLASRPKDLEDIRGMLRIAEVDHAGVERTLAELEAMLDQSDLRPVYARLRAEQASREAGAKAGRRAAGRRAASRTTAARRRGR